MKKFYILSKKKIDKAFGKQGYLTNSQNML